MNESDKRVIALQAALDFASSINAHAPIDLEVGNSAHCNLNDVVFAAERFFNFLAPEYQAAQNKPKIAVAWRDATPDVVEFARGGAPLPATHGAAPLVSTTVGKSPESLREMRKLAEERRAQAEQDNPTERF